MLFFLGPTRLFQDIMVTLVYIYTYIYIYALCIPKSCEFSCWILTCIFQNWSFKISFSFSKSWNKAQKSPFHLSKPSKTREVLGGATEFGGERWEDPIVKPALVAQGGQIVWDPNPPRWGQVEKGRVISKDVGCDFWLRTFFATWFWVINFTKKEQVWEKRCRPPAGPPADGNGLGGFGGATPTPLPAPEEANAVIAWIQDWTPETKSTRWFSLMERLEGLRFFGKHFVWKTTDYERTLFFCVYSNSSLYSSDIFQPFVWCRHIFQWSCNELPGT